MGIELIPDDIGQKWLSEDWRHACAILSEDFPSRMDRYPSGSAGLPTAQVNDLEAGRQALSHIRILQRLLLHAWLAGEGVRH